MADASRGAGFTDGWWEEVLNAERGSRMDGAMSRLTIAAWITQMLEDPAPDWDTLLHDAADMACGQVADDTLRALYHLMRRRGVGW